MLENKTIRFLTYRNKKKTEFYLFSAAFSFVNMICLMNILQNYKNLIVNFNSNITIIPEYIHQKFTNLNKLNENHQEIEFNLFNTHFDFSFNYFFNI